MDNNELQQEILNYNKVKDLILDQLIQENLLDKDDAEEFSNRCQILVYKGSWFEKWFDKNLKPHGKNKEHYYMRIIEMSKKEDEIDKLLRRTTGDYEK